MSTTPSFYELLGVDRNATDKAIEAAFQQQVERNHPKNGGNQAVFALIEQAHGVLINPWARAAYDETLNRTPPRGHVIPSAAFAAGSAEDAGRYYDPNSTSVQPAIGANDSGYGDDASFIDLTDADTDPYDPYGSYDPPAEEDDISVHPDPVETPSRPRFVAEPYADSRMPDWVPSGTALKRVALGVLVIWVLIGIFTPMQLASGLSDGQAVFALLWLFLAWLLLSFALRLGAWIIAIGAIASALFWEADAVDTTVLLLVAASMWLVGQWLFTWRHEGRWRSTMAYFVLSKLPRPLRPDRKQAAAGVHPSF